MTTDDQQSDRRFIEAVEEAIAQGKGLAGVNGVELINSVARHVTVLLRDAYEAFKRASFGTSVFLSITALEETAKAEILAFRVQRKSGDEMRGRDPMRSHSKKHAIAVRPTTFMGRLPSILGNDACGRLRAEAEGGAFAQMREQAIYAYVDATGVSTPATAITKDRAFEILLLACEVADDVIVGYTNESTVLGQQFAAWIDELSREAIAEGSAG